MASGGTHPHDNSPPSPPPSRTTAVIDALLSRGPVLGPTDPWLTVSAVLHRTPVAILEGHLTWLAIRIEPDDHVSARRVLLEDQVRILARALDDGGEDDAVIRGLEQPWDAGAVRVDDDDVVAYAAALGTATTGEPDASPYVALARSAAEVAAEILGHRGSATAPRRSA